MKLQAALDTLTLEECLALLDHTKGAVDIAEVGTPFIIECGMEPVRAIKAAHPEIEVLADAKIMDAGEFEADKCFEAGADIVTVLGVSYDETIEGVVRSAKTHGGQVMVDMIGVMDLAARARELDKMGVDYICVHTAFDIQGTGQNGPAIRLSGSGTVTLENAQAASLTVEQSETARAAVAGGVKLATVDAIAAEKPGVIVVGGAICNADDPAAMATAMKERMKQ